MVTPDAQRTMNTYLGACTGLGPDDIDTGLVSAAQATYVEGYLWDAPEAKKAVLKAFDTAHAAGRLVSITLSDSFCVGRYRDEFRALIRDKVDILFGNEAEIKALFEAESSRRRSRRREGSNRCHHPHRQGLRRDQGRRNSRCAGGAGLQDGRHHGRGRPVRCRLPVRLDPWQVAGRVRRLGGSLPPK